MAFDVLLHFLTLTPELGVMFTISSTGLTLFEYMSKLRSTCSKCLTLRSINQKTSISKNFSTLQNQSSMTIISFMLKGQLGP